MGVLRLRRALVPAALALAMLGVVVAATLGPATGVVAASGSCPYGTCQNSMSSPGPLTWVIGGVLAAIILLAALAIILRRRRRPPAEPPAAWSGPTAPGQPESPAIAETAPYVEGPEDVGPLGGGVAIAGGPPAGATGESGGGDIDSLMGELDRISGEILKRGPGKKTPPPDIGEDEPPANGSG